MKNQPNTPLLVSIITCILPLYFGGCVSSSTSSPAAVLAPSTPTSLDAVAESETVRPAQAAVSLAPMPVQHAVFKELLARRPTIKLAMDWIRTEVAPRYAALIAFQTQLTDAQREQLLRLLAERYETRMDLGAMDPASIMPETPMILTNSYHMRLVKLIGADSAALFDKTEAEPVTWERMRRLDQRLRYEATPLNQQQFTALWSILSDPVYSYHPPLISAEADALVRQRIAANQKALAQASTLLTPAQTKVVSRLLDEDLVIWRVQLYTMAKGQPKGTTP
jgi:hypothetical protein